VCSPPPIIRHGIKPTVLDIRPAINRVIDLFTPNPTVIVQGGGRQITQTSPVPDTRVRPGFSHISDPETATRQPLQNDDIAHLNRDISGRETAHG